MARRRRVRRRRRVIFERRRYGGLKSGSALVESSFQAEMALRDGSLCLGESRGSRCDGTWGEKACII